MQTKLAIGERTGRIYAKGTHAECTRVLTEKKYFKKEPIRIVFEFQKGYFDGLEEQIRQSVPRKEKKPRTVIKWTDEKNQWIRDNDALHVDVLTKLFNETFNENGSRGAINTKRTLLREGVVTTSTNRKDLWSEEQVQMVVDLFGTMTLKDLGKVIGKSASAVNNKVHNLGLRKCRQ